MSNFNVTDILYEQNRRVVCVESSGEGYLRKTDGTQICWGTVQTNQNNYTTTINFPVAFNSLPTIVGGNGMPNRSDYRSNYSTANNSITTSNFVLTKADTGSGQSLYYIAIGKWK